ncbi:MAG: helix-turn-helix transcriptional regulator [Phycisphaeraceae bacterium JB051]
MPENPVLPQMSEWMRSLSVQTLSSGQMRTTELVKHVKTVDATIVAMSMRGRYEVMHSGQSWMIHPGQTMIVPSQTPVTIIHHPDRTGIMQAKWVHLHLTLHGTIDLLRLFDLPGKLTAKPSERVSQVIDKLHQFKITQDSTQQFEQLLLSHQMATSLAHHLIKRGKLSEKQVHKMQQSAQLMPVFEAIAQHLDKSITIDELCSWAHLSASRLHAVFRDATGLAPMRYVMQVRLTQARQQLAYSQSTISQIAQSLGFVNPFHFSRVFKTHVGMSPSEYRKQNAIDQHGM